VGGKKSETSICPGLIMEREERGKSAKANSGGHQCQQEDLGLANAGASVKGNLPRGDEGRG